MAVPLPAGDEADVLVERLRRRYPKPCPQHRRAGDPRHHYCVGGAFLLYLAGRLGEDGLEQQGIRAHRLLRRFPPRPHLARALSTVNPHLEGAGGLRTGTPAMVFAYQIIRANDSGRFGAAWELLARALRYRPGDSLDE